MFKIDMWLVGDRGVTSFTAATKREANTLAEKLRSDATCLQTVVTFPSGKVRICRNPKAKANR